MVDLFLKTVRRLLVPDADFVFRVCERMDLPRDEKRLNLYIHIPFCVNQCLFCPYNTVPYDRAKVPVLFAALREEFKMLRRLHPRFSVDTVYIGGGTPTLVSRELSDFLLWLREEVEVEGSIAVETSPGGFKRGDFEPLKRAGVNMLSVGVQSFNDGVLRFLGRPYDSSSVPPVLDAAKEAGFEHVNIDMIWEVGLQTLDDFDADLNAAIASPVDQITAYPLFKFPHSRFGREKAIARVSMPPFGKRRKFYKHYHDKLLESAFRRVSVWGFSRDPERKYSSVTRPNHIGIGPGSASRIGAGFYFNTFDLDAYTARIEKGEMATSMKLDMTSKLQALYDVYWKYYETEIPLELVGKVDGWAFKIGLGVLNATGMQRREGEKFVLTERGAFWIHLLQNHYILNYIDKVWSVSMREAFPDEIKL